MNTLIRLTWRDPLSRETRELTAPLPLSIGRNANNTLALPSRLLSETHAVLQLEAEQLIVHDQASRNGVSINGTPVQGQAPVHHRDQLQLGPYSFLVDWRGAPRTAAADAITQLTPPSPAQQGTFTSQSLTNVLALPSAARHYAGEFPPAAFAKQKVTLAELEAYGAVEQIPYLTIGGGIGSFVWVDHLRVFGVPADQIASIGFEAKPQNRFLYLSSNSQIPDHERLRSNSDSCPDNLWGWPGYAVREIWSDVARGNVKNAVTVGWQIFNEPFVQTYTPRKGQVFNAVDAEAKRIGWDNIARQGRARAIRKTDDGRYAVAWSQRNADGSTSHRLLICQHLHLAVGYPSIRFLPDLQKFRDETGDQMRVINAYETHDDVYADLAENGGVVVIRGRGIVASRILQRIYEVRQQSGMDIGVLHLMRTPNPQGNQYKSAQRFVSNHWEYQPFNWPKAAWGGPMRRQLEKADPSERKQLLAAWGGTTTADRTDWREIIDKGLAEGWYEILFGKVSNVTQAENGNVITHLEGHGAAKTSTRLEANYIIDATGLETGIDQNALLADLCSHYRLPRNTQNRLHISPDFEVEAMRNGNGNVYACGVATLGGPFAAVDSFLGLQYAAQRSVDHLTAQRAQHLRHLNGVRSLRQWSRWARGVTP